MNTRTTLTAAMILAFAAAGCGKKDDGGAQQTVLQAGPQVYTAPVQVPVSNWETFKAQVSAGQFVNKTYSGDIYNFLVFKGTSSSSGSSKFYYWTSWGSSNYPTVTTTAYTREHDYNGIIKHELCGSESGTQACTTDKVRKALNNLISQTGYYYNSVSQVGANAYGFVTLAGESYVIDLSRPIVANPVLRVKANGDTYRFLSIGEL